MTPYDLPIQYQTTAKGLCHFRHNIECSFYNKQTCSINFDKKLFLGAFDILVYTDKDLEVPELWDESGACMISNSQEVKLRSFTTSIHKVDSMVAYKNDS